MLLVLNSDIFEVDLDGLIVGFFIFLIVCLICYKIITKKRHAIKTTMTVNGKSANNQPKQQEQQQLPDHLYKNNQRFVQWSSSAKLATPKHQRTLSAPVSTTSSNSSYSSTNSSTTKSFLYHQMVKETKIDQFSDTVEVNIGNNEEDEEEEDGASLEKPIVIEVSLQYSSKLKELSIHIIQVCDIPCRSESQTPNSQVRLVVLPTKKVKYKTKVRTGKNAQFLETFVMTKIERTEVHLLSIRLRLYRCERLLRKECLLGQTIIPLSCLNFEIDNNLWLSLDSIMDNNGNGTYTGDGISLTRSNSTTSSTQSMILQQQLHKQRGTVPELLLGLAFNATTGCLTVEVIKGSCFRNSIAHKAPDSYIKLTLLNSIGHEMGRSKTTVCKRQSNPLFKETFRFQVTLYQLADVTLIVCVHNRRGVAKRKEIIGWFSLGLSSSGPEQFAHWMDMKDANHAQVCRWHVLILSPVAIGLSNIL